METRERLVLRKNHRFLINNIDINPVVDCLRESNVLNIDDQERIQAEVVTGDRVGKLLKILTRKCKSYQPLLASVDEHIRKQLQSCEISQEEISKEDQHLDDIVRDILKELCCVEEKSNVTVSALEDEVRQQIIESGIEYRLTQGHLQALVLSTFGDVALGRSGGRQKRTAVYTNLSWRQTDLVSEGNDSDYDFAEEFVKEKLLHLFQETEGNEIEFGTLESVLKRQISCHGKKIRVENIPIKRIVQKTFPKVVYKKAKRGKRKIHVFKNMAKKDQDSDDSDDNNNTRCTIWQ